MGKKYYWLKLKSDFFNTKEIKKLRKIAGGDTYTIIYLKMQLLSIRKEGVITFERTEDNLIEQLALELDEEESNIDMTLRFLEAHGLIESLCDDEYLLNRVPELIGSETDAADRMRKMREKRKVHNNVTHLLQHVTQRKSESIDTEKSDSSSSDDQAMSPTLQQANNLAQLLSDLHVKEDPKFKGNPFSWRKDIEKLLRIDERDPSEIERVIRWVKSPDCFWFAHIMSGKKLREKFPQLVAQMKTDTANPDSSGAVIVDNGPLEFEELL